MLHLMLKVNWISDIMQSFQDLDHVVLIRVIGVISHTHYSSQDVTQIIPTLLYKETNAS